MYDTLASTYEMKKYIKVPQSNSGWGLQYI